MSKLTANAKIGNFIRDLREKRGLTQDEFAEILETSQSAIARMESGEQNFTTQMLERVSNALDHSILKLADSSLDFQIKGGGQLYGSIATNTSKNGAMGLLCASMLNKGKTTLHGIPRIEEVYRILEVMTSIGIECDWIENNSLIIQTPKEFDLDNIDADAARRTRTILMFLGPLIHCFESFKIPNSQGCKLGKRTIAPHLYGLQKMGVDIKTTSNFYEVKVKNLRPSTVVLYEAGDTATENLLLAAARIPGKTVLKFTSSNYMVQEVCFFLQKLGIKIEGIGGTHLTIYGMEEIDQDIEYWNSEDPIESMMFLSAAVTTHSQITIERTPIDFLELELNRLETMGLKYKLGKIYKAKNGFTKLVDLTVFPSILKASEEKITCGPYPNINIDNLPFFVPIATQAKGKTLIHDWVYENRAIYFLELAKLGANILLADPHRVFVEGPTELKPAQVVCPPALRPAMIILIGMLAGNGNSILRNVYSINRGYEEIAERLNSIGAKIKVLHGIG